MALTSSAVRNRGHYEPLPGGVHFVPFPDPLRIGGGSADAALATTMAAIDELFATLCYPDYVAAFLVGLALAGRLQSVFAAWSDGARDRLEGKVPGQVGATAIEQTNGAGGRRGVGTTNHASTARR